MENSIVSIIINNNNPTSQIHKVRVAQEWQLNLIIELAAVSVINVQKNYINQNNYTKVMSL